MQIGVPERLPVLGSTIPGVLVGNYCFHYPQWYLLAAWSAVPALVKSALPLPLEQPRVGGPVYGDWCQNPLTVARGERSLGGVAGDIGAGVVDAAEQVVYNAGQLFDNLLGNPIADGTYTLQLLRGGKYLHIVGGCHRQDGCDVKLWEMVSSAANRFRFVVKKEVGSYTIRNGTGPGSFVEVDANQALKDGGQVQMWQANAPLGQHGTNQLWHFYKVPNRPGLYVIRNVLSGLVLGGKDECVRRNGCAIGQERARNNDPTQVWKLEKVN